MPPTKQRHAIDLLLVEDDPAVRDVLARLLQADGYRVTEASDGPQAISLASEQEFGVVVTDLGLPGIQGAELIERLAQDHAATTFVVVTGLLDAGLPRSSVLDRAIVGVLSKPIDRDEFSRLVTHARDLHAARKSVEKGGRGADQAPTRILVVEDNPADVALLKRDIAKLYATAPSIVVADCLADAEDLLAQGDIDLVLSELGLPDARGLDAVRRLQRVAPTTALIVLTGLKDDELGDHALQLGAQDYLIKGEFGLPSLKRVIRHSMNRKRAQNELARLAQIDHLTGLANRFGFHDLGSRALARARRRGSGVAILYLDLDGFKAINDTLGHKAGDAVLGEVSARLQGAIRDIDLAARLGGDEFAVLVEDVRSEDTARRATQRIPAAFSDPLETAKGLPVSFSIGMSLHPAHGDSVDELLSAADQAMYDAKRSGQGLIRVWSNGAGAVT